MDIPDDLINSQLVEIATYDSASFEDLLTILMLRDNNISEAVETINRFKTITAPDPFSSLEIINDNLLDEVIIALGVIRSSLPQDGSIDRLFANYCAELLTSIGDLQKLFRDHISYTQIRLAEATGHAAVLKSQINKLQRHTYIEPSPVTSQINSSSAEFPGDVNPNDANIIGTES